MYSVPLSSHPLPCSLHVSPPSLILRPIHPSLPSPDCSSPYLSHTHLTPFPLRLLTSPPLILPHREHAAYDVFLSYRVNSDAHHAEKLYNMLTERYVRSHIHDHAPTLCVVSLLYHRLFDGLDATPSTVVEFSTDFNTYPYSLTHPVIPSVTNPFPPFPSFLRPNS
jgi:hypothetical protein